MKLKCDVVVVGAGPAGSIASTFLSKKGFKVIMVDKSKYPREKPCGGGIPISILKKLPFLKKYDLVEIYSHGGYIHSPSLKNCAVLQSNEPIVAFVSRDNFDNKLAMMAVENGAEFIDGKMAKDVRVTDEKAEVVLDDGTTIDSEVIVGADGIYSMVAEKTGLSTKNKPVNTCVYQEYKLDEKTMLDYTDEKHLCHLHMLYDNVPGYAWLFPKKDSFNIGIGEFISSKKKNLKTNLFDSYSSYLDLLKKEKLIPDNLKIGKVKGGCVPSYVLKKTYSDRALLVGDAAGFINQVSGGGIYYAMISGEIASSAITKAFESENFNSTNLSNYQTSWMDEFGKDLYALSRISKIWLKKSENLIKIVSKDKRLEAIASSFLNGDIRIRDYRTKIIKYYIQDRIKELFGLQ